MSKNSFDPIKNAREFFVDTPIGKLHIHSKHTGEYGTDFMNDYPGVFIDLVGKDGLEVMLACVEIRQREGAPSDRYLYQFWKR